MARAAILSRRDAGGGLSLVTLVPEETAAERYVAAGQYLEAQTPPHEHGYFALASDVGARPWQLLVRNTGGAADILARSAIGTEVEVVGPLGAGFPVDRTRGRPLVIAVVASALGVARALLAQRLADRERAPTEVLVGVRAAVDVPLVDEVDGWISRGIGVELCLSRVELDEHRAVLPRARRAAGWVQSVLAHRVEQGGIPAGTIVCAAGPPGMLGDLVALAERQAALGAHLDVLVNAG